MVVVGVSNENGSNNGGIASVTIGGITATEVGASAPYASLWYASVPTGATTSVVVTCQIGALNQVAIVVGAVTGESSATPNATSSYPTTLAADPQTIPSVGTSTVARNGVAVVFAAGGNGGTPTWTNTTSSVGDYYTFSTTGNTLAALLAHSYATGNQKYTLRGSIGNGYGFNGITAVVGDWTP